MATALGRSESALVGRKRELAFLTSGLNDALAGAGRVFLVAGEPGIGKTRLADELARVAIRGGARVLWGRCWEGGGAPAYWPRVQIIRNYSDDGGGSRFGADTAEVLRLIPEVARASPESTSEVISDLEQTRFRLFDSTALLLTRAAAATPQVLILEDLHAADQPSLLLLHFLARELRRARVLLIGTYREAEVRRSAGLASVLGAVARDSQRLSLAGLDAEEIGDLIEATHHRVLPPSVIAVVHQATEGNPFFADEVARSLIARNHWPNAGAPLDVPDGVREAIRRRLQPLADGVQELLAVASVIGREFDVQLLSRVLATPPVALVERLAPAVDAGVLHETLDTIGRYAFSHALIRETLRHDLPPVRRIQLHHTVGEELEKLLAARAEPNYAELAHHFFHAAAAGGADKAVEYSVLAAQQAFQQLAYEEAASHYERALEGLNFREPDEDRRCDLLLALGEAQRRADLAPKANGTFRRAGAAARKVGSRERFAKAALGFTRQGESGVVSPEVVALLEEALEQLGGEDSVLLARVLSRLAMALYFSPAHERREALSRRAVEMAQRLGDSAASIPALVARHFALWGPGTVQTRLGIAGEIVLLGEQEGERELALEGQLWRTVDLLEIGDGAGFQREWQIFEHSVATTRLRSYEWHAELIRGMLALSEGRLEDAEASAVRALRLGQEAHVARAQQFFGVQFFVLRRRQGRLVELEDAVRTYSENFPTLPIWRCGLALLYAELDRPSESRSLFEVLALREFADLPPDGNWLPAMAMLTDVCVFLGDVPRAEMLYQRLLPYASQNVVISEAIAFLAPVDYYLGRLAALLQRWDDARAHLDAAVAEVESLGASLLVAETRRAQESLPPVGAISDGGETAARDPRPQAKEDEGRAGARVFCREGSFWTVVFAGVVLRLKDSRGLFYIHYLLCHPGREFHCTDLLAAAQPAAAGPAVDSARADFELRSLRASGADPLLDARAKAAYRERLRELREELEEAEEFNDLGRTERLQEEIEALTHQLTAAAGLGGRDRTAPSDAERARIAVTKAITLVLKTIAGENPALRRYLRQTLKTGRFCSFTPDPDAPGAWTL